MKSLSLLLGLALTGCTSMGLKRNMPDKVTLQFKARVNEVTDTRYHSSERTRQYSEGQITRDRQEQTDFTIRTTTKAVSGDVISSLVETVQKEGTGSLHDLAFPELNETLDYQTKPDGTVLKAGAFPPQSIFYLPSMPIPDHAVAVGDTWTMERLWLSAREQIPLKLGLVAILKAIVPCEGKNTCADIEISGDVTLAIPPRAKGSRFQSRLWGRLLFSLERGDILWSEMRSAEDMAVGKSHSENGSCMISEMKTGAKYKSNFACDPAPSAVISVPSF